MKRIAATTGLLLLAVLVSLMYSPRGTDRPTGNVDTPIKREARDSPEASAEAGAVDSISLTQEELHPDPTPVASSAEDEAEVRKEVRDFAARYVQDVYSLVIRDFDVTKDQMDALVELLIESEIAATRTAFSTGEGLDARERAERIAAIIGDEQLQIFLARERDIYEYQELANVNSMLNLDEKQIGQLLQVFIDVRQQINESPIDSNLAPIDYVQAKIEQEDDFDRLVLELAPSVLTTTQFESLHEAYQAQSYHRVRNLEAQKRAVLLDPTKAPFVGYPARN